jgi:hypothetical protein
MTGRERRQFTRVALDAYVRVIIPANRASIESRVRDLSENGVFLIARATRPIGTELQLHIDITPDLVIRAKGIVVHEVKADEAAVSAQVAWESCSSRSNRISKSSALSSRAVSRSRRISA